MDYKYTTDPESPNVYHVLYNCPEAKKILKDNAVYAPPPVSQKRQPCQVCLDTVGAWVKSLKN